jgi:hypothetical protein
MIVTRLKLPLEQAEYTALLKMAGDELRNPIDQARFILRQELERRGLLVIETQADPDPARVDALPMQETKQEGKHVTG